MEKVKSLNDIISFNNNFKTAINLYLSLNKPDKVLSYIPTKSSVKFLGEYAEAIIKNKEQATLLVGPYGKGKSHLLLVLLAVLSMERTDKNSEIIKKLINKIKDVDEIGYLVADNLKKIWKKEKFLPILITDTTGDLNQAFLLGLNEALKRDGLTELIPDTYYSIAQDKLLDWKINYKDTFEEFEMKIAEHGMNIQQFQSNLKRFSKETMNIFKKIYPEVTAGSDFNPMTVSEVLPLYKSTCEKLKEEYGYSGIYIVFDEFSKFIESQDGIATGANMKLVQDICELATDSHGAQLFFTMVAHKSIKEYGKYLSQDIINSFTGIEGRIIEKYFITSSKNNYELIKNAIIKSSGFLNKIPNSDKYFGSGVCDKYYQLPAFRSNFDRTEFEKTILKGCYPLNPMGAYILLNISEKVAQNERTLFTFVSNDEPHSMARYVAEHKESDDWVIGVDLIYDYFSTLFKKEVSNEYIHNLWLSAEYALERCITEDQKKIIKALAVILIVNKEDELPATDKTLNLCVAVDDGPQAINELVQLEFIYQKSSTGNYMFKTKAGSELKKEIKRQRSLKGDNVNYAKALIDVTGKYYVIPRKYNTIFSMTRYFTNQFMDINDFLDINSSDILLSDCSGDGKVITLYSFSKLEQEKVKNHLIDLNDSRIVIICPKKSLRLKKQLKDYEIIQELRNNQSFTANNKILKKEMPLLIEDITDEINTYLSEIYEEDSNTKVLYNDNGEIKIIKVGNEETAVNKCCETLFTKTPEINNELVNREVIGTTQTKKARINIINAILSNNDTEEYYTGTSQEATIYRALFTVTGIKDNNIKHNVQCVLKEINNFIESCSDKKVSMSILVSRLKSKPYGMRMGVIPFYLAYVMENRREDIVVYFADKEIPVDADIIVNMCENSDDYSVYVSREDLQKEKYICELNRLFFVEENRNLSANRIKNIFICMQRWFRALPQVSRNLVDIDKYIESENIITSMKFIKKSMQQMEFNPFESLFVEFPKKFGTQSLEDTFCVLDDCKTYYDDYFDWIQARIISEIYTIWGGKKKRDLFHCLKEWYENQSKRSKQALYDRKMTSFMTVIETLDVYNDTEVAKKIAKAVTDVYVENWNVGSIEEFIDNLKNVKTGIESLKDEISTGEMTLSFTRKNGEPFEKTYNYADESTGSVLRNIIEDTLEEYDDLSVNDRVSILLEMIEKITK
ncbi:hypothetical protein [Anaerostipes sp. Marseille-Q3525]|uniref:hypothetical protein n=1 Tax=Anaerostipes sp. Marseille-Q3525 TaxID=2758418 RepID=UPI001BAC8779|nr:hypothetical protein [Anaerostipes sp. Marseille-Q3525]MBR9962143.1 hypothetical protein [Anaerostipes sp. Marseille-Q3525]